MPERPNILLILADEHRFDCLGAYGNRQVRSPHLDALAAEGTRYENCFCPYPVCTPSRYSLLSGQYVHDHAGWSNHSTPRPGVELWPAALRRAGYRTAAVGKMHFTPTYLDVGFDRMLLAEQHGIGRLDDDHHRDIRRLGLIDAVDIADQEDYYRQRAGAEYWDSFGARVSDLPEELHSTSWTGQRAVEELDRWRGQGNLLAVGFIKPHHPFDPPSRWADLYDVDRTELLAGWTEHVPEVDRQRYEGYFPNDRLTERAMRRVTAYYYATISHLDFQVGRMIERLKRQGLYDDTLIIYTADHGDYMGFHHQLLKGGHLYDPLVKTPLLIKWPGGRRAGQVDSSLVSLVDLAPTILGLAGERFESQQTPGFDLSAGPAGRPVAFCEMRRRFEPKTELSMMARSADRKLLWTEGRPSLLFDLSADPLELTDIADRPEERETLARLTAAAERWLGQGNAVANYVDEQAATISQANVPGVDDGHRESMWGYIVEKMGQGEAPMPRG